MKKKRKMKASTRVKVKKTHKKNSNNNDKKQKSERKNNQNEKESNKNQESSNSQEQQINENNNRPLSKDEMSQRIKSGQSVNGMVDADGDTWYQAPGNNDMIGYTKPDGTQCTIGGCTTPEEQHHTSIDQQPTDNEQRYDYDHNGIYRTPREQKAHERWIQDQIDWANQQKNKK
ncbi:putative lipoprotein [Staphylococcus caprae]|uniref:hypothetical protein n=1 Tax=Staphylococcus caprae TaxID=29380 RepID=UPI000DFCCD05|nr:hypothetical protein [Staphylococcus caprae]SUL96186.1 putative lipoprotein [Staphylococcus caprae]